MLCFVFLSWSGETLLSSLQCGQMPLQPWGSLQISSADAGLPSKPGKSHWSPCPAQKPADDEQQPMAARGAGWRAAALQLAGAGKALPARVSQGCSGKLGRLGLLQETGSSLTSGRGGGSRQQPHKPEQKEATSLGQLCLLVRNGVVFPAPPMPPQHHHS